MHLALHATTLQDSLEETRCELRQLSNTFEVQATELHYLQNKVHDTFDGVFNWTGGPLVALKRARERLLKLQLPPKPPPNPTTRAHNRAPETLKLSRRDVEKHLPQVQKVVSKYGEDFFAEMDRQVKVADDLATKNAELVKARNSLRRELHTVKDKAGTARVNEARMQGIAGNLQHQQKPPVAAMKGLLQNALARSEDINLERLLFLLFEDFKRGVRSFHAYMAERITVYDTMPLRLFSYYDPFDGICNLLEDYIRFGFHKSHDGCDGAEFCKLRCQVCRFVGEKGVIISAVMTRVEYLLDGGYYLGFWDHPDHYDDIIAIAKDPSSFHAIEYSGLPDGIAGLGPSLMKFYDVYLSQATRDSMMTERKGGEAARVGVTGTVTSLRAFALLNEQRGDLTDDLRATINQKRREAKHTSSHVDNDKDQHVAAYQERRANADAEVAFAAEEAARNEAEVRRQEQEKAEKQAKVAEERSQREKAKELEQVAVAQRKEEREKKRKEALLEKQKKQAASLR
ncbi:hypothetical protein CYMTET_16403 [Cymbomonas tetramitiformis]|uniref:Uncharacterized protein n=1 Tax=Cymbomonas tetramitiformis TaxID=36881 RepID=A0AAE0GCA3_9CHLO|nr:hypothetical protein CYMTET_16403 [Cymbomonas tetramitiformis]